MVRAQIFIQPFLTPMNKFLAMMDWIYTERGFESQSIYKMDIDFIIVKTGSDYDYWTRNDNVWN